MQELEDMPSRVRQDAFRVLRRADHLLAASIRYGTPWLTYCRRACSALVLPSTSRITTDRSRGVRERSGRAFFEANDWIFGHGLAYQFLVNEQAKPYLGGVDVTGSGAQYGDFMMATAGAAGFSVIVEMKKPGTPMMGNRSYRNGAWLIGGELAAGVAQVQANCQLWAVEITDEGESRPTS